MPDRLPAGYVTDREIGATADNPVQAHKLQHIYKLTENFGLNISDYIKKIQIGTRAKIGATAGWAVGAPDNLPYLATLPASQAGSTLILPIDGLPVGATITGFRIVSQIESAGGAVTLDGDLRATTNVAAEPTDASIGTMTQVSVTADTASSQEKTGLSEVVTSGKTYYLKLTGTTALATDIILQACEVYYTELITKRVILHVADKAGTLMEAGAGLADTGTNTSISFDLQTEPATSLLTGAIAVTHAVADRVEVAGVVSGTGAYGAGAVISAVITVTNAVGAVAPWLRIVLRENGD